MKGVNKIFSIAGILILGFFIAFILDQGFLMFKNPKLTGQVISEFKEEENNENQGFSENLLDFESCYDSDSGLNYEEKGVVEYCDKNGECRSEEDYCLNGKLNEWYCEGGKLALEGYHVCHGFCNKGICMTGLGSSEDTKSSSTPVPISGSDNLKIAYHDLGDLIFSRIDVGKDERVRFSFLDAEYIIVLSDISNTEVVINLDRRESNTIKVGGEVKFDLNTDGVFDIFVKLNSINTITKKARISFTKII